MKKGSVIIFPTDTIYGMASKLYDKVGLERIMDIKKRDENKQIPVLISDLVSINLIAKYDSKALEVMTTFWPGALTVILDTTPEFCKKTGEKTIALRIPNHYLAIELIHQFGPLRTTSVNISGETPLNTYQEVADKFGDVVDKIYGEHVNDYIGVASTVIDLTNSEIKLIREGAIPFSDILEVYNK